MAETRPVGRPRLTTEGYLSRISVRLPESDVALLAVLTHSVGGFVRDAISERIERIKHDSHRAAALGGS